MPSSSELLEFAIPLKAALNPPNEICGMNRIALMYLSCVVNGVEDEYRVPRNYANTFASMGQADDLTGDMLLFCRYFVFSNFSSKYSVYVAFYICNYVLDCLSINCSDCFIHAYYASPFFVILNPLIIMTDQVF